MYILKGCLKCKGDLCPQEDMYGAYLKCLQCGRITENALPDTSGIKTSGVKSVAAKSVKEPAHNQAA